MGLFGALSVETLWVHWWFNYYGRSLQVAALLYVGLRDVHLPLGAIAIHPGQVEGVRFLPDWNSSTFFYVCVCGPLSYYSRGSMFGRPLGLSNPSRIIICTRIASSKGICTSGVAGRSANGR